MFLNERDKLCFNRHDFFVLFFLCSEFKLENIYSGVNFSGKMFALIFICGSLEKPQRLEHKHFVPHGIGPKKTI